MVNLKSLLTDTMRVKFDFYRDGALWYSTMNGFQFPVSIDSIKPKAVLKATDFAKKFEFYIKKNLIKENKSIDIYYFML
jgi:hypothetical protein